MRQLFWGRDFFVRYVKLPWHIGGISSLNPDGTFDIYINESHDSTQQFASLQHELVHCEAGHLDERRDIPADLKEWEAENLQPIVTGTEQ